MADRNSQDKLNLEELDEMLTSELKKIEESVLEKFSEEKGWECSIHSLHGTIGGKNNTYVDSIKTQFSDPNDFKAKWINGFIEYIGDSKYSPLRNLLKDGEFRNYTLTFLERNFYRNLLERTRAKPDENLWTIWFGSGNLIWGLLISPVIRGGEWTNDVSEVRRKRFDYWTVGHVMETGIIDPENNEIVKFSSLNNFCQFYKSILKRVSNSLYEKHFYDAYTKYLLNSDDYLLEPFMIPELRYLGLEKKHLYRLDFTILNPHTMVLIGIELSPTSTHMAVSKIKDKTQEAVNEEIAVKWSKEMDKRNKYFADFGITTVTFTDENLKNMDWCFDYIKKYLQSRGEKNLNLETQIERLNHI